MSGFLSLSVPIWTDRSMSVPSYPVGGQHGAGEARSHVMKPAVVAAHRHDAAVAATEAAPHDAFDRHLARSPESRGGFGCRRQHALRAARVDHHRRVIFS